MATRNGTKSNNGRHNTTLKNKVEQHEPTKNQGYIRVPWNVKQIILY